MNSAGRISIAKNAKDYAKAYLTRLLFIEASKFTQMRENYPSPQWDYLFTPQIAFY